MSSLAARQRFSPPDENMEIFLNSYVHLNETPSTICRPRKKGVRAFLSNMMRGSIGLLTKGNRIMRFCRSASSTRVDLPFDDGAGQPPLCLSEIHDVGGVEKLLSSRIDLSEKPLQLWEKQTHALLVLLSSKKLIKVDELRRAIEQLHPTHYQNFTYYEKWAAAMAQVLMEGKHISTDSLREESAVFGHDPLFFVGQAVQVREENIMSRWRKPHLRTP